MSNIYLKVPSIDELYYRQEWMKDSKTMSYNAGFDVDLKGYDKKTGTITKTDKEMVSWYNNCFTVVSLPNTFSIFSLSVWINPAFLNTFIAPILSNGTISDNSLISLFSNATFSNSSKA